MSDASYCYRRVLLKLSGEAVSGEGELGINAQTLRATAEAIATCARKGIQIAVVPGGGNIVRGAALAEAGLISRETADQMGMLGTIINGLALTHAIAEAGAPAVLLSATEVRGIAPLYSTIAAEDALSHGSVIVLAAGTGQPYFTTDTGSALRAAQLGCDAILKATKVDGVYSADPKKDPAATRYESLSLADAVAKKLRVTDLTALTLCEEHTIDLVVFDFNAEGSLDRVLRGDTTIGTRVTASK
ncbi:MAG: UMP kinase [Phycisphaerales bacterium JB065]